MDAKQVFPFEFVNIEVVFSNHGHRVSWQRVMNGARSEFDVTQRMHHPVLWKANTSKRQKLHRLLKQRLQDSASLLIHRPLRIQTNEVTAPIALPHCHASPFPISSQRPDFVEWVVPPITLVD